MREERLSQGQSRKGAVLLKVRSSKDYLRGVILLVLLVLGVGLFFGKEVLAGDEACTEPGYGVCWPTRIINQWSCDHCEPGYYCSELGISGGGVRKVI